MISGSRAPCRSGEKGRVGCEDGKHGFQVQWGDGREGDNGQWAREQGREGVQILFGYTGVASSTGECVCKSFRTGRELLWPEVFDDQEGGLEDPGLDDLNLDAVGERRGRRG